MKLSFYKIVISLCLLSCASVERGHLSIEKQHLVYEFRSEPVLVNKVCKEQRFGKCKTSEKIYKFSDSNFRKLANDAKLNCYLQGKRFSICLDKEGFCRKEEICKKRSRSFFSKGKCQKKEIKDIFINSYEKDYLINSGAYCFKRKL